jgi:hypothetical protein
MINVINYIAMGVEQSGHMESKFEQHEHLRNHLMKTKIVMDYPYIRRVKSAERFVPEKYIVRNDTIRKTKSFNVKVYDKN